jgi:triacylglycerol lipase
MSLVAAALALAAGAAFAQVTPELKAKIAEIGTLIDPPSSAELYAPLQPASLYAAVRVTRNQSYGSDERNILDVFTPQSAAKAAAPILLFVPGGGGNKQEATSKGIFYDNVAVWAVRNGMIGVNMQRRQGPAWDASARDVSAAIQWVKKNAAKYGGDPNRVFVWGHSNGAAATANYVSHRELWGPGGVGVKGAVLMAGPYNLAPIRPTSPPLQLRQGRNAPAQVFQNDASDPAADLQRSMLPGLKRSPVPLFVSAAELDPPILVEQARTLNQELCAVKKCPQFALYKEHGHMSEIFAVGTTDVSTSKPVLDWMRRIR